MPSFDIVSQVDKQEVTNAVDQANRELQNRFDFKGVDAKFEFSDDQITMTAPSDFQLQQMQEILKSKISKRDIDVKALNFQDVNVQLSNATQVVKVTQGIETPIAKDIIKLIKNEKLKVQTAIQGDQLRVSGKKRDDLQTVIAFLKEKDMSLPLQYINFRD